MGEKVAEVVEEVKEKIVEVAEEVKEKVEDMAEKVKEKVEEMAPKAKEDESPGRSLWTRSWRRSRPPRRRFAAGRPLPKFGASPASPWGWRPKGFPRTGIHVCPSWLCATG